MPLKLSQLPPRSPEYKLARQKLQVSESGVVTKAKVREVREQISDGELKLTAAQNRAFENLAAAVEGPSQAPPVKGQSQSAASMITGKRDALDDKQGLERLNPTQRKVVAKSFARAQGLSKAKHKEGLEVAKEWGYTAADYKKLLAYIAKEAPITLTFNPEKTLEVQVRSGKKLPDYDVSVGRDEHLIDAFLVDGTYKNQFETGLSGASATAYEGGTRDDWEKKLFRRGYHGHKLKQQERPKYGALNPAKLIGGGARQFGACYFVMKSEVRERTTFTPKDGSYCDADQVGTTDHFEHLIADMGAFQVSHMMEVALGNRALSPDTDAASYSYIEAQIHGDVDFAKDVDHMVVDVRYKGTPYEKKLRAFAVTNGFGLKWQNDKKLTVDKKAAAGKV